MTIPHLTLLLLHLTPFYPLALLDLILVDRCNKVPKRVNITSKSVRSEQLLGSEVSPLPMRLNNKRDIIFFVLEKQFPF